MASSTDLTTFVAALPKCELHMHLEGALEPYLVRQFATRNSLPIPAAALDESRTVGYAFDSLPSFLAVYYANMAVLQTSDDFRDLAWHYLCKCREQNVLHVEMFFDPQAHTSRGVSFATVIGGYRAAILKAQREWGMSAYLILCFLRDMSAEYAMATLLQGLDYREWIVGVGLDSDEKGHPPKKFQAVFERARKEGLMVTAHCDIDQENSIEHIRQCVWELNVDRIDHGTNIVEDEGLVEEVKKRGLGLTCCPISNSSVTADFKGKEIVSLLRKGVRVTVNSDDPAYFRSYKAENVEKMSNDAGVSKKELVQLERNAFEAAWLPARKREEFLAKLEAFAKEYC